LIFYGEHMHFLKYLASLGAGDDVLTAENIEEIHCTGGRPSVAVLVYCGCHPISMVV
jgi:hypothetical protein